jgi:translation initiation factor 5
VEGKGKGNTVLTNIVEVSKSLARPPAYPIKFFALELGTIVTFDAAHGSNGKYIMKGTSFSSPLSPFLLLFSPLDHACLFMLM